MKQFCLLLFVIKIVGSAPPDPAINVKYHGAKRYWTSVNSDGKTYLALNILKEAVTGSINLLFPKDKNLRQILSDITLYSVSNDACRLDNNKLGSKLQFDDQKWIRAEVRPMNRAIMAYMYDICNGVDNTDSYASYIIDGQYNIIDGPGRTCFLEGDPFQAYDKDNTKNAMKLEVSGSFKCQIFMTLPNYMDVEDEALPSDAREPINATFAEQGEAFWWKSVQYESFSNGIFFHDRDVVIDMKASTIDIPYYLRIGKDQPYPSLNFKFDPASSNQEYDLYVNLRGGDCKINLALTQTGFKVTTKGVTTEILDSTKSPTFVFAQCPDIGKKLQKNPNAATSGESWNNFVCRVKRTPINSHQFLSYNGPATKVKNADEINHWKVIRGEKRPNKLRECSRRCSFKNSLHPNNFTFEAELSGDLTIATQTTQQPSSN